MRSIICRYVITSGPPTSKPWPERCPVPADAGEVADDVVERDRLGRRRDPARGDHRRQTIDEGDDGLERGASPADDHRGAQRRDRSRSGSQALAGLAPAAEVGRGGGTVVAEPTEIDDLALRPPARKLRRRSARLPDPGARSPGSRGSGRGSRRPPRPRRLAPRPPAEDASPSTQRMPDSASLALRDTATISWSDASRGRSAVPTTPVAPKTTTFTRLPSRPGDRSSGG